MINYFSCFNFFLFFIIFLRLNCPQVQYIVIDITITTIFWWCQVVVMKAIAVIALITSCTSFSRS